MNTKFKIEFIEDQLGQITIDDFKENFIVNTEYWDQKKYKNQWSRSLELMKNGENSIFLTSISEHPLSTKRAWVCYIINSEAVFQEHLIFPEELVTEFDENKPELSIQDYESIDEDGDQISEWRIKNNT